MTRSRDPSLCVVVPVYNEARLVSSFIPALCACLGKLVSHYQVIVVDDGSTDETLTKLQTLTRLYPVEVLALARNFGKEAALTAGLDQASGDAVLLIDGDFQHPFSLIETFLERWNNGVDMVYGVCEKRHTSLTHKLLTSLFYRLMNSCDEVTIPPNGGDFRLMDIQVVRALRRLPERRRLMKGLCAWVGFRTEGIPFQPSDRPAGVSRFPSKRLIQLALTGITSFSVMPLRLVSLLGFMISFLATAFGFYILVESMVNHNPATGWPTVVVLICFLGGIQLLGLGIIGEYIAGIYNEIKQRPLYLVKNRFGSNSQKQHEPLPFPHSVSGRNNSSEHD